MKTIFLLIILFSCKSKEDKEYDKLMEDTDKLITEIKAKKYSDSMVDATMKNAMYDTIGVTSGPVKVIRSRIIEQDYSSYKNVGLTYKNVSGKKIDAIRFKWYGVDAFGEPADLGSYTVDGFGGGFSDDALSPGKTRSSEWSVLSSRGKKILHAWAYEVAFADGTKWKSEYK